MRNKVETDAIAFVTQYYHDRGYSVENGCRKKRGEHAGYDLLVKKSTEILRVEAKGCSRPYGIPDPYYSEFDPETRRLVADLLCVVYCRTDQKEELAVIPRESIPPEFVHLKKRTGSAENSRTRKRSGGFL